MPPSLDLAVESGDFQLENVAMRLFTLLTDLLVAVGAGVDVRLLRAHVAAGHDGVGVRVGQLA